MRVLSNINPELLEILDWWKDWVFSLDVETNATIGNHGQKTEKEATSLEYLKDLQKKPHIGFPEAAHGLSFDTDTHAYPAEWREVCREMDKKMIGFLGVKGSAVKMYYPEGGHLGWHNNANAPGYNIIASYTENGKGHFTYEDPITKEIVRQQDPGGWTVKVGYFGGHDEEDKIFWHCAGTDEPRLTVAYVINDQWMWEEMIMDIEDV